MFPCTVLKKCKLRTLKVKKETCICFKLFTLHVFYYIKLIFYTDSVKINKCKFITKHDGVRQVSDDGVRQVSDGACRFQNLIKQTKYLLDSAHFSLFQANYHIFQVIFLFQKITSPSWPSVNLFSEKRPTLKAQIELDKKNAYNKYVKPPNIKKYGLTMN